MIGERTCTYEWKGGQGVIGESRHWTRTLVYGLSQQDRDLKNPPSPTIKPWVGQSIPQGVFSPITVKYHKA